MMHPELVKAVVAKARLRYEQGDYPTEPADTVETLENAILSLAPTTPTAAPAPNAQALVKAASKTLAYLDRYNLMPKADRRAFQAALAAIQAPAGKGATPPAGDRGQG